MADKVKSFKIELIIKKLNATIYELAECKNSDSFEIKSSIKHIHFVLELLKSFNRVEKNKIGGLSPEEIEDIANKYNR